MPRSVGSSPGLSLFPFAATFQRIILTTLILGSGVAIGYNLLQGISLGKTESDIIMEFVTHETSTGSFEKIAGATTDGTIFTKSGSFQTGPLANPFFEVTETGALVTQTLSGKTLVLSDTTIGSLTGTDICISTGSNTICACGSCD